MCYSFCRLQTGRMVTIYPVFSVKNSGIMVRVLVWDAGVLNLWFLSMIKSKGRQWFE